MKVTWQEAVQGRSFYAIFGEGVELLVWYNPTNPKLCWGWEMNERGVRYSGGFVETVAIAKYRAEEALNKRRTSIGA